MELVEVRTPVAGGTNGPEIAPPSPIRGIGSIRDSDSIVTTGTREHRSVSVGTRTMSVKTIVEAAVEKQRGREKEPAYAIWPLPGRMICVVRWVRSLTYFIRVGSKAEDRSTYSPSCSDGGLGRGADWQRKLPCVG